MATGSDRRQPATAWVGVILFGGTLMITLGIFNVIQGLVAINEEPILMRTADGPVVWDVSTWGWIHLAIGILVILTGAFLIQGAVWARVAAIVLVIVNASTQMIFLPVYPFWSLLVIAVDLWILWAVTFHGREVRD